jgi:Domain of unknown function (DUF1905)/Bacteriocin-protection, YdeI or OmpD-Associated
VKFRGRIEAARGGGAYVALPFDPKQALGKARAPVRGTVNGTPFRSTVAVYGGDAYLGLSKELRAAAGADVGDVVDVELEQDDEPREVELPAELAGDADAAAAFAKLSYTHKREYARWLDEAKRPETRARRAAKAAQMLRDGVKTPG